MFSNPQAASGGDFFDGNGFQNDLVSHSGYPSQPSGNAYSNPQLAKNNVAKQALSTLVNLENLDVSAKEAQQKAKEDEIAKFQAAAPKKSMAQLAKESSQLHAGVSLPLGGHTMSPPTQSFQNPYGMGTAMPFPPGQQGMMMTSGQGMMMNAGQGMMMNAGPGMARNNFPPNNGFGMYNNIQSGQQMGGGMPGFGNNNMNFQGFSNNPF
ncbi:hypothetical protein GUITHDRAFT_152841 [Guillardia theta CCMP2712]|uniref:Uncharacterized protein n=1 Tax=Guillardia theta (strain CCMP2712) TaxID=905079 RepID=L1JAG7_GUITC|nr:hypothetical protein GUITHDRAFT_152841 [Guillardia theta CCMP2712]EKX45090.1 hypothetical protein GUITHDRAFT_152841 [Guillardia theta CCMP2712]|eukprot:XP_005832070.1 hypothetical protein GUITHDRAFT_152841 [Guillardia theta CCMP2712]